MSRIKKIKYALRNLDKNSFYCWIRLYLGRPNDEIEENLEIIDRLARTGWVKQKSNPSDEFITCKAAIPK